MWDNMIVDFLKLFGSILPVDYNETTKVRITEGYILDVTRIYEHIYYCRLDKAKLARIYKI
jgi:hypothetical protein